MCCTGSKAWSPVCEGVRFPHAKVPFFAVHADVSTMKPLACAVSYYVLKRWFHLALPLVSDVFPAYAHMVRLAR